MTRGFLTLTRMAIKSWPKKTRSFINIHDSLFQDLKFKTTILSDLVNSNSKNIVSIEDYSIGSDILKNIQDYEDLAIDKSVFATADDNVTVDDLNNQGRLFDAEGNYLQLSDLAKGLVSNKYSMGLMNGSNTSLADFKEDMPEYVKLFELQSAEAGYFMYGAFPKTQWRSGVIDSANVYAKAIVGTKIIQDFSSLRNEAVIGHNNEFLEVAFKNTTSNGTFADAFALELVNNPYACEIFVNPLVSEESMGYIIQIKTDSLAYLSVIKSGDSFYQTVKAAQSIVGRDIYYEALNPDIYVGSLKLEDVPLVNQLTPKQGIGSSHSMLDTFNLVKERNPASFEALKGKPVDFFKNYTSARINDITAVYMDGVLDYQYKYQSWKQSEFIANSQKNLDSQKAELIDGFEKQTDAIKQLAELGNVSTDLQSAATGIKESVDLLNSENTEHYSVLNDAVTTSSAQFSSNQSSINTAINSISNQESDSFNNLEQLNTETQEISKQMDENDKEMEESMKEDTETTDEYIETE